MEISSTEYHDKIAQEYDEAYTETFWKFYHDLTWKYIERFLPDNINKSLILDAGGGTGIWSIKIAKLGYNIILTDVSKGMLSVAKQKIEEEKLVSKIKIVEADIINMPEFGNETFDLILAEGDPLSYCSKPKTAVSELARVCKRDGFVIASVDNKITWAKRHFENGNFEEAEKIIETGIAQMSTENSDFYPAFTFTISELERIFRENNLEVVFQIGKPSFTSPKLLENKNNYDYLLNFELIHSTKKCFANIGGHIAIIGKKI